MSLSWAPYCLDMSELPPAGDDYAQHIILIVVVVAAASAKSPTMIKFIYELDATGAYTLYDRAINGLVVAIASASQESAKTVFGVELNLRLSFNFALFYTIDQLRALTL